MLTFAVRISRFGAHFGPVFLWTLRLVKGWAADRYDEQLAPRHSHCFSYEEIHSAQQQQQQRQQQSDSLAPVLAWSSVEANIASSTRTRGRLSPAARFSSSLPLPLSPSCSPFLLPGVELRGSRGTPRTSCASVLFASLVRPDRLSLSLSLFLPTFLFARHFIPQSLSFSHLDQPK